MNGDQSPPNGNNNLRFVFLLAKTVFKLRGFQHQVLIPESLE